MVSLFFLHISVNTTWKRTMESSMKRILRTMIWQSPEGTLRKIKSFLIVLETCAVKWSEWQVSAKNEVRVFQKLWRICCLNCNTCKWLDVLVSSEKDDKPSPAFPLYWLAGEPRGIHALLARSRGRGSWCCAVTSMLIGYIGPYLSQL